MNVSSVRLQEVHFSSGNSDCGSPLLGQMLMSMQHLYTDGENAELMMVMLKKSKFSATKHSIK